MKDEGRKKFIIDKWGIPGHPNPSPTERPYYLVEKRFLNNGIISVNADGTEVENGHSAAGHVKGIVQLRGK